MKVLSRLSSLLKICMFMGLALVSMELHAQEGTFTAKGVVKDDSGAPVVGATVLDTKTRNYAVTDNEGNFSLKVAKGSLLQISCIGYTQQAISVLAGKTFYDVLLPESSLALDELVVVGYAVQKKATLTGAVSAVNNEQIVTTKNENVQNMLAGKVSGLRVVQNSSEPGAFNTSLDIRGFGSPLVVIDGVPRGNMSRIDAEDIESVSVLKDASAAIYGVRAANGVILVTTKKGSQSRATISYNGNMAWQMPSNFPSLTGAVDWMTLYNERDMHNVDNQNHRTYTDSQIQEYIDGTKKGTDWRANVFREYAPQTQHTLSMTGGTDKVTYYTSIGYQYQGSFLQTDAINYGKYTLRSNISAKVANNLQFDLNISGMLDEKQSSVYGASDIVRGMWLMQPMDQVWYDESMAQYWQPTNGGLQNPVAMMNKDLTGRNSYKSKWFQSSASLTYNVPFVEGLYFKGLYSYDFTLNDNKEYVSSYQLYNVSGNATTWNAQSEAPNKISRYYYGKNASLWQAQMGYDHVFGNHHVGAMILFENAHNDGDNFYGTRQSLLPIDQVFAGITEKQTFNQSQSASALYEYANQALVGRLNYDYAGKYIAEVAFRYEGSSRFPQASRWDIFPSVSAGWRLSEEKFWKQSVLSFINNLKFRGSYGKMGDDSAMAYQFITGYNYPSSGSGTTTLPGGYIFDGEYVNSSNNKGLANNAISWYVSKTFNVGMDLEAWKGLLGLTAEYFSRERSGLLTTRLNSLPGVVGASLPQENLNSDLTRGFEIELSHKNHLGDFYYQIAGNLSYTRTQTLHYEQARQGNSYLNWRSNVNDRYNNIWWGYSQNGRINSWDEIYYNPVYVGRGTVLGDYEYEDWNQDGWINDLDVHPLATNGVVPLVNFGLTLSAQWHGLDVSLLLQGAGKRYIAMREFLYQPLWADTNALTQYLDRWHPTDPTANPYDPATSWEEGLYGYTGTNPNANSEFNIQNAAYVRLKNVEIGYSLPEKWMKSLNIQGVRVYVSGYNMLTLTRLKYMDPEFFVHPSGSGLSNMGYNYPLNKTLTLGVNVKF